MERRVRLAVNNPLWDLILRQWLFGRLSAHLRSDARLDVIDLGAGRGGSTKVLRGLLPNARITATDADPAQVAAAKDFLKGVADEVGMADAATLPFASESADLVVAMNLFHHVADWRRALDETHRVLRRGGRLVVAGITDRGLGGGAFLRFVAPRSTYSRRTFMDAARDAGFRAVHDHGSERYIRAILERV